MSTNVEDDDPHGEDDYRVFDDELDVPPVAPLKTIHDLGPMEDLPKRWRVKVGDEIRRGQRSWTVMAADDLGYEIMDPIGFRSRVTGR